jgi:hypothetical protein
MDLSKLATIFAERKEPAFRLAQAKRAFYVDLVSGWEGISTYSKALRDEMSALVPWDALTEVTTQISKEGDTVKRLLQCADGKKIEAVLMRHGDGRNTVCISCQVGCPMGCTFCATGTMGLIRNLEVSEMVEQVVHFMRFLKPEGGRVTNVVFMGMGEPMNNYDRCMEAVRVLKKSFTMAGRLSVLISPKVKKGKKPPKALLWRHFHRIYNFLDRGLLMMEFLVDRLQNRPVDSKGDLMELEFVQNYYYRWRSSSHRYDTEPFLRNLPNKFLTYGSEWFDDMRRYEKVIRPAKGIKKRAKDIRKPWTQAHPVHTMR